MQRPPDFQDLTCAQCRQAVDLGFDFTMAFQPIVDWASRSVVGYEALVRGLQGQSAVQVIAQVHDGNRYRFDQACRVKAIALAAELGLKGFLNINFLPNAVYRPELCIRTTLEAARLHDFPIQQIVFEITEVEKVERSEHLKQIVNYYNAQGFRTALDDFGAGYSGLGLLADFQTDFLKLDMGLIRGIEQDRVRQAIVRHTVGLCRELGIQPLAEGVETASELKALVDLRIELFQGYYFARPEVARLPSVDRNCFALH